MSYRNYRAAARAIFTLIQAFCPAEGEQRARPGSLIRGAKNKGSYVLALAVIALAHGGTTPSFFYSWIKKT